MLPYITIGSLNIRLYDFFNTLGLIAALILNLCFYHMKADVLSTYSKLLLQKNSKSSAAKFIIAETILLTAVQHYAGGFCNSSWAAYLNGGGANYFGLVYLSPPIFLLICMLLRVNPLKQLDLFTPSYAMALVFYKVACLFQGCCRGKPWDYGLYFVNRERYEIPSQLLEAIVAALILLYLMHMLRKQLIPGSMFPTYLILYSGTRFFTEFTRDNDVILLGLQLYQIQCIAGVLLGIIELVLIRKFGQKWSDTFERKQEQFIQSRKKDISAQS